MFKKIKEFLKNYGCKDGQRFYVACTSRLNLQYAY